MVEDGSSHDGKGTKEREKEGPESNIPIYENLLKVLAIGIAPQVGNQFFNTWLLGDTHPNYSSPITEQPASKASAGCLCIQ
jgi:hypothetical protein